MRVSPFIALIVLIPLLAMICETALMDGVAERHHRFHDTYHVSSSLTHAMTLAMAFMGLMGLAFGCLSHVRMLGIDEDVTLAFFMSFLVVSLLIWVQMHVYKVVTFEDRMRVVSFMGVSRTISYAAITKMEWHRASPLMGYENLYVYADGRRVLLSGLLDLDQILIRTNRLDTVTNG